MDYVVADNALHFISTLENESVDLLLTDPPYGDIVDEAWDVVWKDDAEYGKWLAGIMRAMRPKMKPNGSIVFFGAVGRHGHRPMWRAMILIELDGLYYARDYVTWGKKRGYGRQFAYLFTREEIAWYSCAEGRTDVNFNIPLTKELRGYAGFSKKYPAKSPYKRVTNVWSDIPELFKPKIQCEKPVPLMERLVLTHSNPGQLVVDLFCGRGTTGVPCKMHGRDFRGCEIKPELAAEANQRIVDTDVIAAQAESQ